VVIYKSGSPFPKGKRQKNMENLVNSYKNYLILQNTKPRGIEEKTRSAKAFLEYLGPADLRSVGYKEAEDYREYLSSAQDKSGGSRYHPATVNCHLAYLRSFFGFLLSQELVFKNPFKGIEKMKEGVKIQKNILSVNQMGKLLSSIRINSMEDLKFLTVLEVLYSTGMRISELESLQEEDISLDQGILIIRDDKNRRDRKLVLTESARSLLSIYLKHYPYQSETPFAHGQSRTFNRWVNNRLKRLCHDLHLPHITCHGFRHSIATHLLKNGASLREVQEFLGHSRVKNTEVYTRVLTEDLKKSIEKNHPRERNVK